MIVYLAFLIPIIFAIFLFVFYKHETKWWEILVPMFLSVVFVLIAKLISVNSLTIDEEWLGGYITEVQYYEPWDEKVSCKHPKYCTTCSGSGKSRECNTDICGYDHLFDVDYHSEYWRAITTLNDFNITKLRYDQLVIQFGGKKEFFNEKRNYYSIDGNMYRTKWNNNDETLESITEIETYENRPKASHSIFHYQELDSFEIKTYKPFDYPNIVNYNQNTLLGFNDFNAIHKLNVLNSKLGKSKQVRVFILIFKNKEKESAFIQERYWQGGNMNEIIVCIGVNNKNEINWGHVFSWTESIMVIIKIKHTIENKKIANLIDIIDFIQNEIKFEWKRKNFHDFDYINIEPTINQIIVIYLLTILINIGISYWIIKNNI